MTRILFVDDEARILEALRNVFRRYRHRWDMTFAEGGAQALELLGKQHFDVVVSDMRMPTVDGVDILRHVKEHSPDTLRFVLSGYTDTASALRVVPIAHQVLMKPCDVTQIYHALCRADELRQVMTDPRIARLAGSARSLPSPPRVYLDLVEVLTSETSSAGQVAAVVEQDPAMTAKVLQIVNSAFFGLPRKITGVKTAVSYLGTETIRHLVLAVKAFECVDGNDATFVEARRLHAIRTARMARSVAGREHRNAAFVAGMLHDVGTLLLSAHLPKEYARVCDIALARGVPRRVVEAEVFGTTHAHIGGYLLGMWGLDLDIVDAVLHHHDDPPSRERVAQGDLTVSEALRFADAWSHSSEDHGTCETPEPPALAMGGVQ